MALRRRAQLLEYSPAALTCGAILRVDDTALGPGCLWPGERPALSDRRGSHNNEHWYVGAGLVLRRYGPFRSDAAIDYEHAIVGQLRERGWPVAVPIPSDAGRMVVVDDGRRYSLFPRLVGRHGSPRRPRQPRELRGFWAGCTAISPLSRSRGHRIPFRRFFEMPADPAWQRLDALDNPVLSGLIRRKLAEVHARGRVSRQRAAWRATRARRLARREHLVPGRDCSGILDFDFAHPDLPLVDVAIAALIPEVEDSAQIAIGYFGARAPTEHELDLIATAQQARALGHVASFLAATSTEITARSTRSDSASTCSCVPNNAGPRSGRDLERHNRLTRPTFRPDMDSRYGTRAAGGAGQCRH